MSSKAAFKFVIVIGLVSLCADMTYEGARSITGAFLGDLGASGAVVGFVAGFGELIGYGLRLGIGVLSDRTRQYWKITTLGYFLNTAVVPLLALAGTWPIAAGLMMAERTGKAIRTPPRDVLLSYAVSQTGRGFGFGLHEAMDQIGAVMGPLAVAWILTTQQGYAPGFAILAFPAVAGLVVLLIAQRVYPNPQDFEKKPLTLEREGLPKVFWLYLGAVALLAAGFADFPLIAFHLQQQAVISDTQIPLLYAWAMGVDAIAALILGRLFDRIGILTLMIAVFISAGFAPLVLLGNAPLVFIGMTLWGIGMGAQESILKAIVAGLVPPDKRGSAYGLFQAGYGLFWFLGSAVMGLLYDQVILGVVVFSVVMHLATLPLLQVLRQFETKAT